MRDQLAAAMAQARAPQGGAMPPMPQMEMPPQGMPPQGMDPMAPSAAGPAEGEIFREAMNIAAGELGPQAPQQAVMQRAMEILQIAGIVPPQDMQGPGGPGPMMPPGGMPPRGM